MYDAVWLGRRFLGLRRLLWKKNYKNLFGGKSTGVDGEEHTKIGCVFLFGPELFVCVLLKITKIAQKISCVFLSGFFVCSSPSAPPVNWIFNLENY